MAYLDERELIAGSFKERKYGFSLSLKIKTLLRGTFFYLLSNSCHEKHWFRLEHTSSSNTAIPQMFRLVNYKKVTKEINGRLVNSQECNWLVGTSSAL